MTTPFIKDDYHSVWAQYSIRVNNREQLQSELKDKGIPTAVHYPQPLHLQECFRYLGYSIGNFPISEKISNEIMSLPMNPYLTENQLDYISKELVKAL